MVGDSRIRRVGVRRRVSNLYVRMNSVLCLKSVPNQEYHTDRPSLSVVSSTGSGYFMSLLGDVTST